MNPQLHPRSLLVSAHAYRPCVSRRSKKVAVRLAAGSRLLKIVLPPVPCRQGRPTQCLKPRAENTRIGSEITSEKPNYLQRLLAYINFPFLRCPLETQIYSLVGNGRPR